MAIVKFMCHKSVICQALNRNCRKLKSVEVTCNSTASIPGVLKIAELIHKLKHTHTHTHTHMSYSTLQTVLHSLDRMVWQKWNSICSMILTTGKTFADYSNLQWIAHLPLHNRIWKWHIETVLLAAEKFTVISEKNESIK